MAPKATAAVLADMVEAPLVELEGLAEVEAEAEAEALIVLATPVVTAAWAEEAAAAVPLAEAVAAAAEETTANMIRLITWLSLYKIQ